MSVPDRFENVKRLSLCIICLSKNHKVTQCTSTFKCKICSRSHLTSSTFSLSPAPQPTVQTTSAVDNLPMLQKTLLGWVVSGKYNSDTPFSTKSSAFLLSCEEAINFNLEQLWKLDEISSTPKLTDEKYNCETEFCNTVLRNASGRVVVRLPFKDTLSSLGLSRDIVFRRFTALERRLSHMPEIKAQYVAFMIEYENLGHMTRIEGPDLRTSHCYIPHHCVLKPNSTSKKLRVVFDASYRTTTQKSLNSILMVGATI
ncbi:uncharacterized protein LOC119667399 [Teleopsis dalmanni]|uniref:uncharacterized protein LOC119667399 n=1 Tax=Teleopsis dalmanni TaxID=139649 RepID=UPI0018CD7EAE|nr:uncharacterized protein LOC119667399 [Teleopsis dalmanni]